MTPISLGYVAVATPGTPVSIDANFAAVVGSYPSPTITITSTTNKMKIAVDGGADQTVTLTVGVWDVEHVASEIMAQATGLTASKTARGQLYIASNTRTTSSALVIKTISNSAYTLLGLVVGAFKSLPEAICGKITIRPKPGNTGPIYVGVSQTFVKTTGIDLLDVLITDTASYVDRFEVCGEGNVLHSSQYWLDADNASDAAICVAYVG